MSTVSGWCINGITVKEASVDGFVDGDRNAAGQELIFPPGYGIDSMGDMTDIDDRV